MNESIDVIYCIHDRQLSIKESETWAQEQNIKTILTPHLIPKGGLQFPLDIKTKMGYLSREVRII